MLSPLTLWEGGIIKGAITLSLIVLVPSSEKICLFLEVLHVGRDLAFQKNFSSVIFYMQT